MGTAGLIKNTHKDQCSETSMLRYCDGKPVWKYQQGSTRLLWRLFSEIGYF